MSRVGGEESINSMAYSQRLIHARLFNIQERCVPWYDPSCMHLCVPRYLQLHIHPVEMYIDTAKTPPCHTTEPYIYHHRSRILASLPVCQKLEPNPRNLSASIPSRIQFVYKYGNRATFSRPHHYHKAHHQGTTMQLPRKVIELEDFPSHPIPSHHRLNRCS